MRGAMLYKLKNANYRFLLNTSIILIFCLLILVIIANREFIKKHLDLEYQRIESELKTVTDIVSTIDYAFSHHFRVNNQEQTNYKFTVKDDKCIIRPSDGVFDNDYISNVLESGDYIYYAPASLCHNTLNKSDNIENYLGVIPFVIAMHNISDVVSLVQYIDKNGHVIISSRANLFNHYFEESQVIKNSAIWDILENNKDYVVSLEKDDVNLISDREVLVLASAVYAKGIIQGFVLVQVELKELLDTHNLISGKIRITSEDEVYLVNGNVYYPKKLEFSFANVNNIIYYEWNWANEVYHFFNKRKLSFYLATSIFLLFMTGLFSIKQRIEKSYYFDLSVRDPMTGLLNRRGFEIFWQERKKVRKFAVVIIDIDNFKKINDTFGHDIGDDAIRYLGDQIRCLIGPDNEVARFGGEEFVMYLSTQDEQTLKDLLLTMQEEITQKSIHVVQGGFTISGGVEISSDDSHANFEALLKSADNKLYHAKLCGKNQLVF